MLCLEYHIGMVGVDIAEAIGADFRSFFVPPAVDFGSIVEDREKTKNESFFLCFDDLLLDDDFFEGSLIDKGVFELRDLLFRKSLSLYLDLFYQSVDILEFTLRASHQGTGHYDHQ